MARMLLDPPNFLVLDEPTNHLDLATKEMLVSALKGFEGTMLFGGDQDHAKQICLLQPIERRGEKLPLRRPDLSGGDERHGRDGRG